MYKIYKDKEKRKKWLREYRIKNREEIYRKRKEWIERTKWQYKKEYIPKGKRKESLLGTPGLGRKYEKIALNLLKGSVDKNNDSFCGKWDIEWNGLKIDVKMRNLNKRNTWNFTTHKNPKADYYLCFCVKDKKIIKIYFIPNYIFKENISVSEKNKNYDKFIMSFS